MHHLAAQWIVGLLRDRNIPFLICGGLAAKGYGSERDRNDIDLFVPGEHFSSVVKAGQEFVSKAAAPTGEGWDLAYVQWISRISVLSVRVHNHTHHTERVSQICCAKSTVVLRVKCP